MASIPPTPEGRKVKPPPSSINTSATTAATMSQVRRELARLDVDQSLTGPNVDTLRRFFSLLRHHFFSCSPSPRTPSSSPSKPRTSYRRISASPPPLPTTIETNPPSPFTCLEAPPDSSDLVPLKVSLLGDSQIGKTSFMTKYVGDVEEKMGLHMSGLNLVDKMLHVKGATIVFSIWDVGGSPQFSDHVPIACRDAAAVLVMFDLTSRCTLKSALGWYQRARRWNETGIPILIGTKFDDFVQLPLDMQWTIVNQARACARVMNATLFFSSATHDINVSKIFKFITAKFFNLPWNVERNLTLGEPIIDY